jgi:hypothetical protein
MGRQLFAGGTAGNELLTIAIGAALIALERANEHHSRLASR